MRMIVVVGSAPSPVGRGWGERIDAADMVVRLWDWHWQDAADYGSRCDAALLTTTPPYMARAAALVQRLPRTWWAYDIHGHWSLAPPGEWRGLPVEVINVRGYATAAMRKGFHGTARRRKFDLTRGAAAAVWAMASRRPAELVIVGMDGVLDARWAPARQRYAPGALAAFLPPGDRVSPTPDDGLKTPSHDAAGERWAIDEAARRNGVAVLDAREVWR